MPPKGHHFIPCLHLRHFAGHDPQGQVWTYDAQTESCWSSIPEETAKQTHFYSIEKPDGTMDTRIEEALSGFEGRAVPVYDALLRGDVPKPSKERMYFSQFAGLMIARTPAMRRTQAEIIGRGIQIQNYAYAVHDEAFESLIRRMEKEMHQKMDAATRACLRQSMIDPSKNPVVLPRPSHDRDCH